MYLFFHWHHGQSERKRQEEKERERERATDREREKSESHFGTLLSVCLSPRPLLRVCLQSLPTHLASSSVDATVP